MEIEGDFKVGISQAGKQGNEILLNLIEVMRKINDANKKQLMTYLIFLFYFFGVLLIYHEPNTYGGLKMLRY